MAAAAPSPAANSGPAARSAADARMVRASIATMNVARSHGAVGGRCGAVVVRRETQEVVAWGVHRSLEPSARTSAFDIHAEADALCHAARAGVAVEGCDVFVTKPPCKSCMMLLSAAGIRRVAYCNSLEKTYGDKTGDHVRALAKTHDVTLEEDMPRPTVDELRADRQRASGEGARVLPVRPDIETGEPDPRVEKRFRLTEEPSGDDDDNEFLSQIFGVD